MDEKYVEAVLALVEEVPPRPAEADEVPDDDGPLAGPDAPDDEQERDQP